MDMFVINSIQVHMAFKDYLQNQWKGDEFNNWINGIKDGAGAMWYYFHSADGFAKRLLYSGVQFHPGSIEGGCLRYWRSNVGRFNAQAWKCSDELFFVCEFL